MSNTSDDKTLTGIILMYSITFILYLILKLQITPVPDNGINMTLKCCTHNM